VKAEQLAKKKLKSNSDWLSFGDLLSVANKNGMQYEIKLDKLMKLNRERHSMVHSNATIAQTTLRDFLSGVLALSKRKTGEEIVLYLNSPGTYGL